jgi:hypothetical protein
MGIDIGPIEITDGIIFQIDAANPRSYAGTGLTAFGLISGLGGTFVNGPTYSSNNKGYFVFDGTNDYFQFTLPNLTNWSFSFWLYNHTVPNLSEKQLLSTYTDPTGLSMLFQKYIIWNGTTNQGIASIAQSAWTNVVYTNTGFASCAIYINGVLDNSFNTGNQIYSGPAQLMAINGTQRNTQANLGSFSAYNRALSATEILQNYNATKGRYR